MPDVSGAFARIEEELLASMMANLGRHRASGATWAQWQAEQLAMVDAYARDNAYRMGPRFDAINAEVERMMAEEYARAGREQEMAILEAVARGWRAPSSGGPFGTERGRIDALIRATHSDLMRAEHATLRRADDIYREVVFDAQLYAATGAGTYARAVDMAAEDFLLRGIDGIVYKDGSRHTIREYGQMAVRTAVRRAALSGEGAARDRWGVHTVFVNRRADACPECMAWTGQVLIDDVYSSGTAEEAADGGYPLLSDAMAQGLFHPNCRDTMSTWFEGVNDPGDAPTEDEVALAEGREEREEGQRQADLEATRWQRVADLSLDGQGRREAEARARAASGEAYDIITAPAPTGTSDPGEDMAFRRYVVGDVELLFKDGMDMAKQDMDPERLAKIIEELPKEIRDRVQGRVYVVDYPNPRDDYWRKKYKAFSRSYATGGSDMTFWAHTGHDYDHVRHAVVHEAAHGIDRDMRTKKGTWYSDRAAWRRAQNADHAVSGRWYPTAYGANSQHEDFAESFAMYYRDRERFGEDFPNRMALIESILGIG